MGTVGACPTHLFFADKIEKILKGSQSRSPLSKIQIMSGKVCLRCKGKTLRGVVNKLLKAKNRGSLELLNDTKLIINY